MKAQIKILVYQLAMISLIAIVYKSITLGWADLLGVLYGGSISIAVTIVMACRINQATKKMLAGNQRGNLYIYLGAMERLFVSIVLFGLGFMYLALHPLPITVGLVAGQIGFAIGGYKAKD
ncbi:MAG: hypothetical protein A6F72_01785 [Cycloclasticus sp. symbiont of Poecilosclerida sp. N]|nr:MAG: hypothetical protein A6F72_01785 [Cycloclasticus sp. symbiont of Poecilosclerida sp. N]